MSEPTSEPTREAAERPGLDKVFDARKWMRDWLWKTDTRDIYDGPIIPEISSLMSLAVASAIAAKDAEIQQLTKRVVELEADFRGYTHHAEWIALKNRAIAAEDKLREQVEALKQERVIRDA